MYFSFGIPVGCIDVLSIFGGVINLLGDLLVLFETVFVISSTILFPTKSPVPSAFFLINLFDAVLTASVADFLYYQVAFNYTYYSNLCSYFLQRIKIHNLWHKFDLIIVLSLITKVKFILRVLIDKPYVNVRRL